MACSENGSSRPASPSFSARYCGSPVTRKAQTRSSAPPPPRHSAAARIAAFLPGMPTLRAAPVAGLAGGPRASLLLRLLLRLLRRLEEAHRLARGAEEAALRVD